MTINLCVYCKKLFSTKYSLSRHNTHCKEFLKQLDELKDNEIQILKEKLNNLETENTMLKQILEERALD